MCEFDFFRLSAIDHSCEPNAFVIFDGPKAMLRALKPANAIMPDSLDQVIQVFDIIGFDVMISLDSNCLL